MDSSGDVFVDPLTRALVDLDAIARNLRRLRERVGAGRIFYAVVKADAYGHGGAPVSRRLSREGVDRFAVASPEEGIELRRAGVAGEVLVLSRAEASDLPRLRSYGLTPALYDREQADSVVTAADRGGSPLVVELELDTGMGRTGLRPEELDAVVRRILGSKAVTLAGTFATLSCADDPSSPETARQLATLRACVERMREAGLSPGVVHLANSAGTLGHPDTWLDGVRPGLALYGVEPSEVAAGAGLEPAMTLETRVVSVRRVPAGTPLGYGARFVTTRETKVAVLPIGYHDGFRRSFSGRIEVLLRGRRVPVVGAVSMDLTLVDATEVGAARGDRVLCLGRDGAEEIGVWELARAADTIAWEILCGIGKRIPRVYTGERT